MIAYLDCWRRCFDYSGRTTRGQFWSALFFGIIAFCAWFIFVGVLILMLSEQLSLDPELGPLLLLVGINIYQLLFYVCAVSMTVRRLRDAGYGPRVLWWLLVPVLGLFAILARLLEPSAPAEKL